jgi:hypothetical protein
MAGIVIWTLALLLAALALLVVPFPPGAVERYYSDGLYPAIQSVMTRSSNLTAFAWFDVAIALIVILVVALSARDVARLGMARGTARVLVRMLTVASALLVMFMVMWGLNYQRESLRRKVPYDPARVTPEAAVALAREAVARVNAQHDAAHVQGFFAAGDTDPALVHGFGEASRMLRLNATTVPGRPKRSLLDLYFRRAGVAGMTDPFFLETLVASDILPFERPHVVAHEWAHLAGVTDEGEANFVGWLACLRGSVSHQYSGWLFLYTEVLSALPRERAREVAASLADGPRADLQAMRERSAREVSRRLSSAGWQVYDQYLRANRIEAGTASYAEVVQLVLGTDAGNW